MRRAPCAAGSVNRRAARLTMRLASVPTSSTPSARRVSVPGTWYVGAKRRAPTMQVLAIQLFRPIDRRRCRSKDGCLISPRNSVRANLADRAEAWPWSSAWRMLRGAPSSRAILCDWPIPRPSNWLVRVNRVETKGELESLRRSVQRRGLSAVQNLQPCRKDTAILPAVAGLPTTPVRQQ